MSAIDTVCLLGFGEVGQVLAEELLRGAACRIKAFDVLFDDADSAPSRAVPESSAFERCFEAERAASGCRLILSAVTAEASLAAARSVAGAFAPGTFYLDLNSVSPRSRAETAEVIQAAGGRFVEAAVMSPIEPGRLASPMLLGGPHAAALMGPAADLGFTGLSVYSPEVGPASAAKMCRSVVIKGMEALLMESLLTARHHGVEEDVLRSLNNLLQADDWRERARYMISRSLQHGQRRAAEMREASNTVEGAGLMPWMSAACAHRQDWAGRLGGEADLRDDDLAPLLDAVLSAAGATEGEPGKP